MSKENENIRENTEVSRDMSRIITVIFDRYSIKVRLGGANEFLGIVEVGVSSDFRSVSQKIQSEGSHDVSSFYKAE